MIIVKISGGLGNQLFQFSFGKFLSKKLHTKVLYDIQTNKVLNDFTPRLLNLSFFNIHLDFATKKDIRKMKRFSRGIWERIERIIILKFPFLNKTYFVESSNHQMISNKYIKDNCYYEGYWQTYNYLLLNDIELRKDISLKNSLSKEKIELAKDIVNSESVSIHIRRGDYITIKKNNDKYNICSMDYYLRAIVYLEKLYKNKLRFYVFSDDIDWAKSNFKDEKFNVMQGNQPGEDIYFMSLCKHNIIANSTFSWWGAWLNSNKNRIVITPKNWYKEYTNDSTIEFIPSDWVQL